MGLVMNSTDSMIPIAATGGASAVSIGALGAEPTALPPGLRSVDEMVVPDELPFAGLPETVQYPGLSALPYSAITYVGRVAGSAVDIVVFPITVDGEERVGLYAFAGDLFVDLTTSRLDEPGYLRSIVFEQGHDPVDMFYWGPLSDEISVVTLAIDGELTGAIRPRAGIAAFSTAGVAQDAHLAAKAYDVIGRPVSAIEMQVPTLEDPTD